MTMRRLGRGQLGRAGFTILESLVVLALVAMVVGMSTQLLRPASGRLQLESATRAFCATLRAARARAIASNSETTVIVDVDRKTYFSPVGGEGRLPAETQISLQVANTQRLSAQSGAILFYPDGTSTGADVGLLTPNARATISVNWLTGEATCALG